MKINYKITLPVIILVLLAIVAKKQGWIDSNSSAIEVTTGFIHKRTVIESVMASGKIQPEVEVKMSPEVSGEIIEIYVVEHIPNCFKENSYEYCSLRNLFI